MSREKNYITRFWLLLVVVTVLLCGLYYLPERIGLWHLKPVDLLSELRGAPQLVEEDDSLEWLLAKDLDIDSLQTQQNESAQAPALDSAVQETKSLERRQVYERLKSDQSGQDDTIGRPLIEDYHPQRLGLKHLYEALARGASKGRPTRIAVLGDSFIEGDIMTDALRENLQRQWGGRGVGWMPMTSETAGFRRSIKHQSRNWQDVSLLGKRKRGIPFTGHIFHPQQGAWVRYETPSKSGTLPSSASILYQSARETQLEIKQPQQEGRYISLPATAPREIGAITIEIPEARSVEYRFASEGGDSLVLYGCALEDAEGVSVDNLSLRGNSGILLLSVEESVSKAFAQVRPYDLIVLQYGLNVVSEKQQNYSSYIRQMQRLIVRMRDLYPTTDILLLGVSDRSQRSASGWGRMANIDRLHNAQRLLARSLGITFWSLRDAMQHLGGMPQMVDKGWAAKDYTHMTHRGGSKVAELLLEALMLEKSYYDQIQ